MRYLTPLLTDARGKLGGTVFSRNPYGPYTRAKTAPAQPRTVSQQRGRTAFATASAAWRTLTPDARAAWVTFAATQIRHDSLGQAHRPSGYHAFLTNFRFAQQMGATAAPTPPPVTEQLPLPQFFATATVSTGTGAFVLALTPALPFDFIGGNYIPQATPGLSASVSFVPRQTYRNLTATFTLDHFIDFWHAELAYLAVFPSPAAGSVIFMQIRAANRFTGLVTKPWKVAAVVTAVP